VVAGHVVAAASAVRVAEVVAALAGHVVEAFKAGAALVAVQVAAAFHNAVTLAAALVAVEAILHVVMITQDVKVTASGLIVAIALQASNAVVVLIVTVLIMSQEGTTALREVIMVH
jgi:hypothetical protein